MIEPELENCLRDKFSMHWIKLGLDGVILEAYLANR